MLTWSSIGFDLGIINMLKDFFKKVMWYDH
jgi:hypothetical protein